MDVFWNQAGYPGERKDWSDTTWDETSTHDWKDGQDSPGTWSRRQTWEGQGSPFDENDCIADITWPASSWPVVQAADWNCNTDCSNARYPELTPCVPMEHCEVNIATATEAGPSLFFVDPYFNDFVSSTYEETYTRSAQSTIKLFTGGKGVPHRQSIVEIYAWAAEVKDLRSGCGAAGDGAVPANQTTVGELGRLNDDYTLYAALPDGATKDVTVKSPPKRSNIHIDGSKHELVVTCVATTPKNRERTTVGVAEYVDLKFEPPTQYNQPFWSCTAGTVSPEYPVFASQTRYTACSNAAQANVFAWFKRPDGNFGALTKTTFTVLEPTGIDHSDFLEYWPYPSTTLAGAGFHIRPFVGPLNVSFKRVILREVGRDATGVTGYFIYHPPPSHIGYGADAPISLLDDNSWEPDYDWPRSSGWPAPWSGTGWSGGEYTWEIPATWRVGSGPEHSLSGWNQVHTLLANGTMTIRKLGHTVSRTIQNSYSGN